MALKATDIIYIGLWCFFTKVGLIFMELKATDIISIGLLILIGFMFLIGKTDGEVTLIITSLLSFYFGHATSNNTANTTATNIKDAVCQEPPKTPQ